MTEKMPCHITDEYFKDDPCDYSDDLAPNPAPEQDWLQYDDNGDVI